MVARRKMRTMPSALTPVQRVALFAPPQLLEGEDRAHYEELLARIYADVQPVGVIEELWVADTAYSQWDLMRWRRVKSQLLMVRVLKELEDFLCDVLGYDQYMEDFEGFLEESLQEHLPADEAQKLARRCALNDEDDRQEVNDRVNSLLEGQVMDLDMILDRAKAFRTKQLRIKYGRHETEAVKLINEFLALHGKTMEDFISDALTAELTTIERIDRLISNAEFSRNASLREIDRHRAAFGQAVRRSVQDIEEAEFRVIAPSSRKETA